MAKLRAAVLGCGPAGLLAAHGLTQGAEAMDREVEVKIFSSKRKSPLYGCQYLHASIPGLSLPKQQVRYQLTGTVGGYRRKVYGIEDISVSPAALEEDHSAWDIRAAYDQLWDKYEPAITDWFLSRGSWGLLKRELTLRGFGLVISTIPAPVLCADGGCTFLSESVWAMGDAPGLDRWAVRPAELPDGTILCNGKPEMPWYRISHVFGHHTIEWPGECRGIPRGASRVTKPIRTTCDCNDGEVVRSGRYARWAKGVLAHESYEDGYRMARQAA